MGCRVALVTCSVLPDGWADDHALALALEERGASAEFLVWDDPAVEWDHYDLVVLRSPWDYTGRRDEFLGWADSVGPGLRNSAGLLRWNSDKHYLAELGEAGVPTVPTQLVAPGEELDELRGEVVVKPTVSAGARDTGRFGPASHDAARDLISKIGADGGTVMVQPYLASVDDRGETAILVVSGAVSHVLRKASVLGADEVAPMRVGGISAAEAMFRSDLVVAGSATAAEHALAERVLAEVSERFGAPLYARVDMLAGADCEPVLLELEAVEPSLYLATSDGAAERFAKAILVECER